MVQQPEIGSTGHTEDTFHPFCCLFLYVGSHSATLHARLCLLQHHRCCTPHTDSSMRVLHCLAILLSSLEVTLQVAPELQTNAPFSHIQFSADGKLMLCVAEGHIHQLDAFNGALQQTYNTGVPQGSMGLGAIFSPDSNYILSGLHHWLRLLSIAMHGLMPPAPTICSVTNSKALGDRECSLVSL